jgi:hypothetical protein
VVYVFKKILTLLALCALSLGSIYYISNSDSKVSRESKEGFADISVRNNVVELKFEGDLLDCEAKSKIMLVRDCFYNAMKVALKGTSPIGIFDVINKLSSKGNLYVLRECHVAGHKIGADWVLSGSDPLAAVKVEEIRCEGAFTHGVLDAWALNKPDLAAAGKMSDVCDYEVGLKQGSSFKKVWCWDGLGHAAWVASSEDYLDALKRCATIDSGEGRSYCVEGVFMEVYEPANYERGRGLGRVVEELPVICGKHPKSWLPAGAEEDYRQGCWQGAGYLFTRLVTWDITENESSAMLKARMDRLISLCDLMGEGKEVCMDRLKMASSPNFRYDAEALDYGCSKYRELDTCLESVRSEFKGISRDFDAELRVINLQGESTIIDYRDVAWKSPPVLGKEGNVAASILDQI